MSDSDRDDSVVIASESDSELEEEPFDGADEERVSALALELVRLKSATMRAVQTRERLPQPLFWSLFYSQITEIKRRKARARMLRQVFGE